MSTVHRIARRLTALPFLRWVILPHIAFFTVVWLTDTPALIAVVNSVDIAPSVAVCIALLPSALDAVFRDGPANKAVFLTLDVQSRCVMVQPTRHGGTRYGTGSPRLRHDD